MSLQTTFISDFDYLEAEIRMIKILEDVSNGIDEDNTDFLFDLIDNTYKRQDFNSSVINASHYPVHKIRPIARFVLDTFLKFVETYPEKEYITMAMYTKIVLRSSGNFARQIFNLKEDFANLKIFIEGENRLHFLDKNIKYKGLTKIPAELEEECKNINFFEKNFLTPEFIEWLDYGYPLNSLEYHISIDDVDFIRDNNQIFTQKLLISTVAEIFVHTKFKYDPYVTSLDFAAHHGAINCFKYIIENESSQSINWNKTLKHAIFSKNIEICRICMAHGYNLRKAIKNSAKYHFNFLFHEFEQNKSFHTDMRPELTKIISWKNVELTKYYLKDLKWDPYDKLPLDSSIMKPVHIACMNGLNGVAIHLVLNCGVDPNTTGLNGAFPFSVASESGWPALSDFFFINGGRNRDMTIHRAAEMGFYQTMCNLVNYKMAEIDAKDSHGETPLYKACAHDKNPIVKLLLTKHDVDPNAANVDGNTPLHAASRNLNIEVAQELLKAGARLDAVNRFGKTPLDVVGEAVGLFGTNIQKSVEMNLLLGKYD